MRQFLLYGSNVFIFGCFGCMCMCVSLLCGEEEYASCSSHELLRKGKVSMNLQSTFVWVKMKGISRPICTVVVVFVAVAALPHYMYYERFLLMPAFLCFQFFSLFSLLLCPSNVAISFFFRNKIDKCKLLPLTAMFVQFVPFILLITIIANVTCLLKK